MPLLSNMTNRSSWLNQADATCCIQSSKQAEFAKATELPLAKSIKPQDGVAHSQTKKRLNVQ